MIPHQRLKFWILLVIPIKATTIKMIKSGDSCESLTPVSDLLKTKDLISSASQYPLNYDQTTEFMDKALGTSDVLRLIIIDGVFHLLYDVYPVVTHKSIKNRCRKVRRKIKKMS